MVIFLLSFPQSTLLDGWDVICHHRDAGLALFTLLEKPVDLSLRQLRVVDVFCKRIHPITFSLIQRALKTLNILQDFNTSGWYFFLSVVHLVCMIVTVIAVYVLAKAFMEIWSIVDLILLVAHGIRLDHMVPAHLMSFRYLLHQKSVHGILAPWSATPGTLFGFLGFIHRWIAVGFRLLFSIACAICRQHVRVYEAFGLVLQRRCAGTSGNRNWLLLWLSHSWSTL